MKYILLQDQDVDPQAWDASTPELLAAALLALFRQRDAASVYVELNSQDLEWTRMEVSQAEGLRAALEDGSAPDAMLALMREQLQALERGEIHLQEYARQVALYDRAKQGELEAIAALLCARRENRYEGWELRAVTEAGPIPPSADVPSHHLLEALLAKARS